MTLRGRVLPIGGLKEKSLAAHRGGIKTIIIPKDNEKDIEEIPKKIAKELTIIPVDHMDQVLKNALVLDDPESLFKKREETPLLAPLPQKAVFPLPPSVGVPGQTPIH